MKMKILRNKTKTATITLILVLTFSAILVALPTVVAHDPPWNTPTWCYVAVAPETIGVGQEALIIFWVNLVPPTAVGAYGDRWTFYVDITKPDGSKETLGPRTSDPVGGGYIQYTPDQVGTYTIVARFPGHVLTGEPVPPGGLYSGTRYDVIPFINDNYLASTSDPVTLTVQQEQVPKYQETPLPTDYWTRPVYGANRDWWQMMGQWLGSYAMVDGPTSNTNKYSLGPESPHILWTKSYWSGGVMGGQSGSVGYYSGKSYESFGAPSIILEGKIYYTVSGGSKPNWRQWYSVDLYTGETIYYENNTLGDKRMPSYGQIYDYSSPNQHGGFPYLWRTSGVGSNTWEMIDGFSGNAICRIANVSSSGTAVYGKDGSILRYRIQNLGTSETPNQYLSVWNTSRAIWYRNWTEIRGNAYWTWRPARIAVYDGNNGFSLNVSIPDVSGSIRAVREGEFIIGGSSGSNNGTYIVPGNLWALSLKRGQEGTLLWNITFTPPQEQPDSALLDMQYQNHGMSWGTVDPEDGVFCYEQSLTMERWVYSLDDGTLLWKSEPEPQFNFYGMSDSIYKGRLYSYGYSGVLIAYNITTGKIDWTWSAPYEGLGETWYQHSPLSMGPIADGKLYLYSSEHSHTMPLRRDANIWCVDAETGELIWKLQAMPSSRPIIADGYLVYLDLFDNQVYCIGRGPSATTVTAGPKVTSLGSSVVIEGTVTDQSPSGRRNINDGLDFTLKGTPAISDADMEAWMEHLYQQRPCPADAKGVTVTLDAIDPNGNFVHIDTVTSDMSGMFKKMWTPEMEGEYTIIATFEGSDSYGASYSETVLGVGPAPAPIQPIEPEEPTEAPLITTEIAIIIAVAVVAVIGIVAFYALRKRK